MFIVFFMWKVHFRIFGKSEKSKENKKNKNTLAWGLCLHHLIKTVLVKVTSDSFIMKSTDQTLIITSSAVAAFDSVKNLLLDILDSLGFWDTTHS